MSEPVGDESLIEEIEDPAPPIARGSWSSGDATTLVLVRHGVTPHTQAKRFSGGLGGDNPPLAEEGREQVSLTAAWIKPLLREAAAVIASPVQRTHETGEILASTLGLPLELEPGLAEMEFGHWDGLTFAEVSAQHGDEMKAWLGALERAPRGGESFRDVESRVLAALERLRSAYAGRTVVVASHVTPIKTIVAHALGAPLEAVFRMELAPAAVSVVSFYADDRASLRLYNALPPERFGSEAGLW
ncbi:histidine phosphatase family protein [Nocardioides sp. Kera G14]|uniref:histidine phosphatase family protein n=1 Tax=Nocardioides sp. Kera G14 TaxID=2884264 RepID=UPI001D11297B|nr:histidine phosphatase family protein [Nocardioides sp. Kera G14]UDY24886.1 histidine phosphatase family protein [Nocardioides sp. Kera G14]